MPTSDSADQNEATERFQRRAASLEVNGRRVNEAIERSRDDRSSAIFVCECGNLGCSETLELTISQYEAVRTGFDRFLILPGHEIETVDEIVERHSGYLVVIKREPEARALAHASDERTP